MSPKQLFFTQTSFRDFINNNRRNTITSIMKNIAISVRLPNYKNKVNIHHLYSVKLLLMALVEKFMAYDWIHSKRYMLEP